jgi:uncharacterized protein (DUF427 family)
MVAVWLTCTAWLQDSAKTTVCGWKGTANYKSVEVRLYTDAGGVWSNVFKWCCWF